MQHRDSPAQPNKGYVKMSGTTLCQHCNTRFKITEAQLEAHEGMVRCGHCLQAFDARPCYIPDQPNPQLELPILDDPGTPTVEPSAAAAPSDKTAPTSDEQPQEAPPDDLPGTDTPDMGSNKPAERPMTLAEQIAVVRDENEDGGFAAVRRHRKWPWAVAAFLLLLSLLAQAAYFFRADLAVRLPALKPVLTGYCRILGCNVPLPQNHYLMSIESSDLEANPEHFNQITLNALLRNRASYQQAFPHLELTLNDTNDVPLARRTFKPLDYLPPSENEHAGMRPNQELGVKLHLHTADLRPTGYRLVLFYPQP